MDGADEDWLLRGQGILEPFLRIIIRLIGFPFLG